MSTKSRKKQRKRRSLFLSLLMIGFTGVVLTTSTYAWFTANQTVSVENIDVNVAAANGLQISVDGVNWKSIVSNADILGAKATYPGAVNQLPSSTNNLIPVSSALEINEKNGFLKMFAGEVSSDDGGSFTLSATESVETNGDTGDFVAFDLFFQVTGNTPIYLTSESSIVTSGESKGLQNAGRAAFVVQGNVPTGTDKDTIQGLKATADSEVVLWEPNYDVHTAAAVAHAKSVYGIDTSEADADQLTYYGVNQVIGKELNVPVASNETYFTQMTPDISTTAAGISADDYEDLITLQPGVTKVRIYLWVEGQDVDCENNASGSAVTYNLQFSSLSSVSDTN